jgi:hypothetical protein
VHRRKKKTFLLFFPFLLLFPQKIPAQTSIESLPIEALDPFGPPDLYYDTLRSAFKSPEDVERVIRRLWKTYKETNNPKYGFWILNYTNLLWQGLEKEEDRKKVAKGATQLARELREKYPKNPEPAFWEPVFLGFYALSVGILNALQYLPVYQSSLKWLIENKPDYFYGGAYLLLARLYMKAPPFPVSIGDLEKAFQYLELARPYEENRYGLWHIFKAEAEYLKYGKEKMLKTLKEVDNVCPVDVTTRYTYEISKYYAEELLKAIETGEYDRYQWDPLLKPITALIHKRYDPKRFCR